MKAMPLPPLIVAEVELVNENVTLPSRTLQGLAVEQVAPISRVVGELALAAKSVSWLAFCTEGPPLPLSSVQVFAPAQPKRFAPAAAFVIKNISPTEHVDGSAAPDFRGRVVGAVVKSTFLLWACRSIWVWLQACGRQNEMTMNRDNISPNTSLC